MKIGITIMATDVSIGAAELAAAAEARGFSSLYLPEHTHIPTSRETPPPVGQEDVLPERYKRILDPFVALGACAEATETLTIGTGICLVAQRDPIATAKAVATLDFMSGGRFVFGIGYGWNVDEMRDHGVAYDERRSVVRDFMLTMRALWADEPQSFEGKHASVSESWAWPKPARKPGPPVMIGGAAGPRLFAHVAEFGDGWLPVGGGGIKKSLPMLGEAAEAAGRDPSELRVVPLWALPDRDKLDYYASLGIEEVVLQFPSEPRDPAMRTLDELAPLVDEFAS